MKISDSRFQSDLYSLISRTNEEKLEQYGVIKGKALCVGQVNLPTLVVDCLAELFAFGQQQIELPSRPLAQ